MTCILSTRAVSKEQRQGELVDGERFAEKKEYNVDTTTNIEKRKMFV